MPHKPHPTDPNKVIYESRKYNIEELSIPTTATYTASPPAPTNIIFFDTSKGPQREVLRITPDGIISNPDVPVDEAAQAILRALEGYIKAMTKREWVGLTEDEVFAISNAMPYANRFEFANAIEAKLKEKNT